MEIREQRMELYHREGSVIEEYANNLRVYEHKSKKMHKVRGRLVLTYPGLVEPTMDLPLVLHFTTDMMPE